MQMEKKKKKTFKANTSFNEMSSVNNIKSGQFYKMKKICTRRRGWVGKSEIGGGIKKRESTQIG